MRHCLPSHITSLWIRDIYKWAMNRVSISVFSCTTTVKRLLSSPNHIHRANGCQCRIPIRERQREGAAINLGHDRNRYQCNRPSTSSNFTVTHKTWHLAVTPGRDGIRKNGRDQFSRLSDSGTRSNYFIVFRQSRFSCVGVKAAQLPSLYT